MQKRITVNEGGCLLWEGMLDRDGYGVVSIRGRTMRVHVLMHYLYYGDIARGLERHHRCRNKRCCNPDHIEVVSPEEHRERHPENDRHTHCIYGHRYTEENTYVRKGGGRCCRECNRIRVKEWYRKNRLRHRVRAKKKRTPGGVVVDLVI